MTRSLKEQKGTAEKLAKEVPDCKVSVYCLDDQDKLREEIANADILANGTLAGMKPHDDLTLVDKSMFHKDLVVADCVYNPAETRMVKEAKRSRRKTCSRRKRNASVAGRWSPINCTQDLRCLQMSTRNSRLRTKGNKDHEPDR